MRGAPGHGALAERMAGRKHLSRRDAAGAGVPGNENVTRKDAPGPGALAKHVVGNGNIYHEGMRRDAAILRSACPERKNMS